MGNNVQPITVHDDPCVQLFNDLVKFRISEERKDRWNKLSENARISIIQNSKPYLAIEKGLKTQNKLYNTRENLYIKVIENEDFENILPYDSFKDGGMLILMNRINSTRELIYDHHIFKNYIITYSKYTGEYHSGGFVLCPKKERLKMIFPLENKNETDSE